MIQGNKNESGQAIVLLVIALVALLGFVALAIDGGMAYSDRRQAQNGSDAASLAGGGAAALAFETTGVNYQNFKCSDPRVSTTAKDAAEEAARSRAASNGFNLEAGSSVVHGVEYDCVDNFDNGSWIEKYIDVTTLISDTTKTSIAQVFFDGDLVNNVSAVTRVRPRSPLAFGNAIVALNSDPCSGNQNGVIFRGSSKMNVSGGGVFSNGCMTCSGGFTADIVPPATVRYAGTNSSYLGCTDSHNFSGNGPQQASMQLPASSYAIPQPKCTSPGSYNSTTKTYSPGYYNNTVQINNDKEPTTFLPGLYCFRSSPNALKINGSTVNAINVTFFVEKTTASIEINGGEVVLTAPASQPDPAPAIPNVVIYSLGNVVSLSGNGSSAFSGTVYAPNGYVTASGTSDSDSTIQNFSTQIIGKNVEIGGNAEIKIFFNNNQNHARPAGLDLFR